MNKLMKDEQEEKQGEARDRPHGVYTRSLTGEATWNMSKKHELEHTQIDK